MEHLWLQCSSQNTDSRNIKVWFDLKSDWQLKIGQEIRETTKKLSVCHDLRPLGNVHKKLADGLRV